MAKKRKDTTETDLDEMPDLGKARLTAQAKRAKKAHAYDAKLVDKFLDQIGVTRAELEKQADADFAQAKSESKQRLEQLRALQSARLRERGALLRRIKSTLTRFERPAGMK